MLHELEGRQLPSALLMLTYLQALVSVAQAQLPAGHHGLLGAPALSTDQTPALRPVRVWAQHLHAALVTGPSSGESDLCGAERVRDYKAECGCTRDKQDKKTLFFCVSALSKTFKVNIINELYFWLIWLRTCRVFIPLSPASVCIYRKHGTV